MTDMLSSLYICIYILYIYIYIYIYIYNIYIYLKVKKNIAKSLRTSISTNTSAWLLSIKIEATLQICS